MTLRTWKSKEELSEPTFTWCPWIQYGMRGEGNKHGSQENGLGQLRAFVLRDGEMLVGEWEDDHRMTALRETPTERWAEMEAQRARRFGPRNQILTFSRGGQA